LKESNALLKKQLRAGVPQLREIHPNLFVYRPGYPYFPMNWRSTAMAAANAPLYRMEIHRLLSRLNAGKVWLWAFFAQNLSVLDLPFHHFVYDCVDDWPSFFSHPREKSYIARLDEGLCRRADLVFVGSEPLREKKVGFNPRTFVVNHAADVGHFARAADPETKVPEELERIPHPRIGFVGMMDAIRFDASLLGQLAENPGYHLVIVGGVVGGAGKILPAHPNLHWLGMKPVNELPAYLKGMDVCLMPYRLNEATRNIYPLKLHEYLATGKPVVSTAIPAVEDLRDLVYVADSPDHFSQCVAQALSETDETLSSRRRACAQKNSWEAHVSKKALLIRQHLRGD
jgi:glycosyltransferase involved in cell wall biosynthesis